MNARRRQIMLRGVRLMWRYRLRSALLILSAALGVDGVVCSVNYGASGTRQVLDQIRRMGTNVLIVTPAQSRAVAGRARTGAAVTTLIERDYRALKSDILNRTHSSAFVTQSFWTKAGEFSKNATVVGCEPDFFTIKDWQTSAGGLFDALQERSSARVAVLGYTVANDLFDGSWPVGQRILIDRAPFMVIGVLTERGQGLDVSDEDSRIYVPLSTAMRRLMNVDHYAGIVLELDSLSGMDTAADESRLLLRRLHHVHANRADDFQIQNQKTLLDTELDASKRLGFFLRWIAASALVVSGLGTVAITWIAIKERNPEIGTRRALGATGGDIVLQIACESSSLALIGALLGIVLSWPISRFVNDSAALPFNFDRASAVTAFIAAVILNFVFSILLSRKAASISPMAALRHE